jgi:hypothetical protein
MSPLFGFIFIAYYSHLLALSILFYFQNTLAIEQFICGLCPHTSMALLAFFLRVFSGYS